MENQIVPFLFEGESLVRSIAREGEPWFVGADVCRVLGIVKHEQKLATLDNDERGTCPIGTPGGRQTMVIVSEPGLYRLIFQSNKPIAERFKRWLAHEVIPAIRKTGTYSATSAKPAAEQIGHREFPDWPLEETRAKLGIANAYRTAYGVLSAQWVMPKLGFPTPPKHLIDHARQPDLFSNYDDKQDGANANDPDADAA